MKTDSALILITAFLCASCISNPLDSEQEDFPRSSNQSRPYLTKSAQTSQEDSLTTMSKIQRDKDHLMMSRIIFKDSVYILAIKRQDAIFLGVSEETYDRYMEYVEKLNNLE